MRGRRVFALLSVVLVSGMVIGSAGAAWEPADGPLFTRWAKDVSPDNAHPEYPRPQMVRDEWLNLNGLWKLAVAAKDDPKPGQFPLEILVPFPIESALSGVMKRVDEDNRIWYRRTFDVPAGWKGKRVLLHFGAVDWEAGVYVNGDKLGTHRGGYDAFTFDITDALTDSGAQELIVSAWDPVDTGGQARGKQVKNPGGIMYTPTTGIWQTVWIEPVPETYIKSFKIVPDVDAGQLKLNVTAGGAGEEGGVEAVAYDGEREVAKAGGSIGEQIKLNVPDAKLWSPDSPFLYDLKVRLLDGGKQVDEVAGYFGMRKIELGKDEKGITRMLLNGKFVFQIGPLDQGFWPGGLYAAPTDEALRYDVEATRKLGMNMARKHVKIEPDRWYYWCDKLGLLVWQDMPSASSDREGGPWIPESNRKQFEVELRRMVEEFYNHPSIIMWVVFNEGWGQYDTERLTAWVKEMDPSRLVNNASGWADRGVGDVNDIHSYPGPATPEPEADRAIVLGEFGGLGLPLEGHTWQARDNWGYRSYESREDLTNSYVDLIKKLQPMIARGLSAGVYTQTSDVEVEVNGLMTYDRELIKPDVEQVRKANLGFLPPAFPAATDIFIDAGEVEIARTLKGARIRYTLDGSEPMEGSPVYSTPIKLTETTTVKARAYWPDGTQSAVASRTYTKVRPRQAVDVRVRSGLQYQYYEGRWGELPDFDELEPADTGVCEEFDLSPAKRENSYGLKFEGLISVPRDGVYSFYVTSDDGTRLYVGGETVVTNDGTHGMIEASGSVALEKGMHRIKLVFFQGGGGQGLEVGYAGPGVERQDIPAKVLYRER